MCVRYDSPPLFYFIPPHSMNSHRIVQSLDLDYDNDAPYIAIQTECEGYQLTLEEVSAVVSYLDALADIGQAGPGGTRRTEGGQGSLDRVVV